MINAVIFAQKSKIIRRILRSEDETPADLMAHVKQGETIFFVPEEDGHLRACEEHIRRLTGTAPPSSRCAVIHQDTRDVVGVYHADPDLDSVDGHDLVLSDDADVGDRHSDNVFRRRHAIASRETHIVVAVSWDKIGEQESGLDPSHYAVKSLTLQKDDEIPIEHRPRTP